MTNQEKLQSMSTDELAKFLYFYAPCRCCTNRARCLSMTYEQRKAQKPPCEQGHKAWLEREEGAKK